MPPFVIEAKSRYGDAIAHLIKQAEPTATVYVCGAQIDGALRTIGHQLVYGLDGEPKWLDEARDLAHVIGYRLTPDSPTKWRLDHYVPDPRYKGRRKLTVVARQMPGDPHSFDNPSGTEVDEFLAWARRQGAEPTVEGDGSGPVAVWIGCYRFTAGDWAVKVPNAGWLSLPDRQFSTLFREA